MSPCNLFKIETERTNMKAFCSCNASTRNRDCRRSTVYFHFLPRQSAFGMPPVSISLQRNSTQPGWTLVHFSREIMLPEWDVWNMQFFRFLFSIAHRSSFTNKQNSLLNLRVHIHIHIHKSIYLTEEIHFLGSSLQTGKYCQSYYIYI